MNYVLFHKNCVDGFTAAWVCYRKYINELDKWRFIPVQYNEEPPIMVEVENVVIVDFSYQRSVLQLLKNRLAVHGKDLLVIDHHMSAERELKDLDYCVFDNDHSGAVLTWMTLFPDKPVPQLLLYVEDRDLWTWKLQNSRNVNEGIGLFDKSGDLNNQDLLIDNFKNFDYWVEGGEQAIMDLAVQGNAIGGYKDKLIKETIKHVDYRILKIDKHEINVGFINCGVGSLISDVGNECLKANNDLDVCVIYSIDLEKQIVNCSLRGHDKKYKDSDIDIDCGILSKRFQGGGHKNAAGFKVDVDTFFNKIWVK